MPDSDVQIESEQQKARRSRQSLATVGITAFLCCVILYLCWQDAVYFLNKSAPVDLGTAGEMKEGSLVPNSHVKVEGIADPRVQFAESGGKTYRYFILLGSKILVEQRASSSKTSQDLRPFKYKGEGRLFKLDGMVKYEMLLNHFKETLRLDLQDDGYLLKDAYQRTDALPYFALVCASIAALVLSLIRQFIFSREGDQRGDTDA